MPSPDEILNPQQRAFFVGELLRLRPLYPKLDMFEEIIREFAQPPLRPDECVFAKTTTTISADLKTLVMPCQIGGNPDCSQCGCIASMGLASLGHKRLMPGISIAGVLQASGQIGRAMRYLKAGSRGAVGSLKRTSRCLRRAASSNSDSQAA